MRSELLRGVRNNGLLPTWMQRRNGLHVACPWNMDLASLVAAAVTIQWTHADLAVARGVRLGQRCGQSAGSGLINSNDKVKSRFLQVGWRPSLLVTRALLLVARTLLVARALLLVARTLLGWRPSLFG